MVVGGQLARELYTCPGPLNLAEVWSCLPYLAQGLIDFNTLPSQGASALRAPRLAMVGEFLCLESGFPL